MQNSTRIVAILALITVAGAGCTSARPVQIEQTPQDLSIKSVTHSTSDAEGDQVGCSFKWTYPEVQGPAEIASGMNQAIALAVGLASNYPTRFKKTVDESGRDFVASCVKERAEMEKGLEKTEPPITPYISERDFEIKWNQTPILSLVIRSYEYSGGAHGLPYITSVNLDQRTGKQLLLGDLVKNEELRPFMKSVNEAFLFQNRDALFPETAEEMRRFIAGESEIKDEVLANENDFYLTSEGFVFFSNVYDIAPYAAGPLSISLPFSQVKNLLRTDSALETLTR